MNKEKQPKVIAIIPARYGSTRLPGKPLHKISGKSLIQRTYESTTACHLLDEVVVATDDSRILDHVLSFGGKAVMTSKDCATGTDRLVEVVKNQARYSDVSVVLNVQGDLPCIEEDVMKKTLEILEKDPEAVMSTAVFKMKLEEEALSTSVVKCVMDLHGNALYFSRSLIPGNLRSAFHSGTTYFHHIGIYAYRKDFLLKYSQLSPTPLQQAEDLEQLKVLEHGYRLKVAIVNHMCLSVDIPEDIKKVEQFLCRQNTSLSQVECAHP